MKFYNEDDMTEEKFNKFWDEIDEINRKSIENSKLLTENAPKKFNTVEEVRAYYNSIPFEEWENNMREKYGM